MARTKAGSPYSAISFLPVDSPLVRWIGFLSESDGAHLASLATIGLGVFLRWTTALNGYSGGYFHVHYYMLAKIGNTGRSATRFRGCGTSGAGKPPMFGDFEAQRHWMEITYHLPPSQWYFYDLQYWGLDYPPLTAFVSWLCGAAAQFVDPAFVALDASRGIEGPSVKVFMRWTVLVTELLVYLPALYWFARVWKWDWASRDSLFALLYLQPALILVDHGHFQYNAIMLGLAVGAFTSFVRGRYVLGSCFFVLSLMFKQMALYYSLPVFVFLLSKCVWDSNRLRGWVVRGGFVNSRLNALPQLLAPCQTRSYRPCYFGALPLALAKFAGTAAPDRTPSIPGRTGPVRGQGGQFLVRVECCDQAPRALSAKYLGTHQVGIKKMFICGTTYAFLSQHWCHVTRFGAFAPGPLPPQRH